MVAQDVRIDYEFTINRFCNFKTQLTGYNAKTQSQSLQFLHFPKAVCMKEMFGEQFQCYSETELSDSGHGAGGILEYYWSRKHSGGTPVNRAALPQVVQHDSGRGPVAEEPPHLQLHPCCQHGCR